MLYFSLHRYDNGQFFPNRVEADYTHVGGASAEGYNINVAWNRSTMGDAEYIAAFHHLLLPIAYEVSNLLYEVSNLLYMRSVISYIRSVISCISRA